MQILYLNFGNFRDWQRLSSLSLINILFCKFVVYIRIAVIILPSILHLLLSGLHLFFVLFCYPPHLVYSLILFLFLRIRLSLFFPFLWLVCLPTLHAD